MMSASVQAGGLTFRAELHDPPERNTVIIPKDITKATPELLNKLTNTIGSIPFPMSWAVTHSRILRDNQDYAFSSQRPDEEYAQTFVEITDIFKKDAAWLKLKFHEVDLEKAKLIISEPTSGRSQTLNAEQLKRREWTSTIFVSDHLRVQLQVPPSSKVPLPVDKLIDKVLVGEDLAPRRPYPDNEPGQTPEQQGSSDEETTCGADTRIISSDRRVGRIPLAACTAFILDGDVYASAGHCFRENRELQEVHLNVPLSSQGGTPRPAAIEDIYKVITTSIVCSDCDANQNLKHGKDWAVFLLQKNENTNREAIDAQGGGFKITSDLIVNGHSITQLRINGFGWNNKPPTSMYANQTAKGQFKGLARGSTAEDIELHHFVSTEGGNSGSPMIAIDGDGHDTEVVVGIHTGGRCEPQENSPNKGTGFSHQGLLKAVQTLRQLRLVNR